MLVLADVATSRSDTSTFEIGDLRELLDGFRIPAPGNLPRDLTTLERRRLVVRRLGGQGYSVTPEGEDLARSLLPHLGEHIELASAGLQAAPFNRAPHNLLPYELAPVRWRESIRRLVERFPFEHNAFLMTRFPRPDTDDPVAPAIESAREALDEHGLKLHLASDRILDPDVLGNVAAHMWASSFGVAVFECRAEPHLNLNLLAEVGGMMVAGRRCALLKDVSVERFPSDLSGQVWREIDLSNPETVAIALHAWARDDLGR